jgi:hypothetical protein
MPHNRAVYASPPVDGSGYDFAGSFRYAQTFGLNIPTQNLRHILSALRLLRKALIRAAKTSYTAGTLCAIDSEPVTVYNKKN